MDQHLKDLVTEHGFPQIFYIMMAHSQPQDRETGLEMIDALISGLEMAVAITIEKEIKDVENHDRARRAINAIAEEVREGCTQTLNELLEKLGKPSLGITHNEKVALDIMKELENDR